MSMIQQVYPTRALSELLGISRQAVAKRANVESWQASSQLGRGGGKLWLVSSMPAATRDLLASALLRHDHEQRRQPALPHPVQLPLLSTAPTAQAAVPAPASVFPAFSPSVPAVPTVPQISAPALPATPAPALTAAPSPAFARACEHERQVALARLVFVREVERLAVIVRKEKAVRHIVEASRNGTLSPVLADLCQSAVACKRGGVLSRRTLFRWCADYATGGEAALLPHQRKDAPIPAWAEDFLRHYQKPQHPSVALAYKNFCKDLTARGVAKLPSIHAVYRLLDKMGTPEREAGRATGNALLKLRPYKRRSTEELWPGDVYTADGTTFDAEVISPLTGKPFKPELTAVLDVATRRCVGLSIALAESSLTVLDALRMACCFGGVPALFYSDNGPGYTNNLLLDDRTGMFRRLGM